MFQHRHYKAIAEKLSHHAESLLTPQQVIDALADLFAADNPRFDRQRFIAAAIGKPSNWRDRK